MSINLFCFYCLNICVNSLLVFFTAAVIIEFLLFVFRVRTRRLRYLCRLVPFVKLPLDLFRYDFSHWALGWGIDPTLCPKGSRSINVSLGCENLFCPLFSSDIGFDVHHSYGFSVADVLGLSMGQQALLLFCLIFFLFSVGVGILKIRAYYRARHEAEKLFEDVYPCKRKILNPQLLKKVRKWKMALCISEKADNPVVWRRTIVFPANLVDHLEQKEFEAVIAHELAHACWFDSVVNQCVFLICALFWWVPAKKWLRRLEEEQEFACDQSIFRYKILGVDLAGAIHKSLLGSRQSFVFQGVASHPLVKRVKDLTAQRADVPVRKGVLTFQAIALYCLVSALLFGKLWIF